MAKFIRRSDGELGKGDANATTTNQEGEEKPPNAKEVKTMRDEMYEDLKREYDLTAERRRTLTGQASSMLGFAGIIETILIAAIVALATDPDARKLLTTSFVHYPIIILGAIGFISYIITAIYSVRAYHEPKWMPAPQFPVVRDKDLEHSVEVYWDRFPDAYNRKDAAKLLARGIEYDRGVNTDKYDNLKIATSWLRIGIIASVLGGILFLLMAI